MSVQDLKPISISEALRIAGPEFSAKPQPTFFELRWQSWLAEQKIGAERLVFTRIAARQAFAAGWNAALDELGCKEPTPNAAPPEPEKLR